MKGVGGGQSRAVVAGASLSSYAVANLGLESPAAAIGALRRL
jgi:hypothetical protein